MLDILQRGGGLKKNTEFKTAKRPTKTTPVGELMINAELKKNAKLRENKLQLGEPAVDPIPPMPLIIENKLLVGYFNKIINMFKLFRIDNILEEQQRFLRYLLKQLEDVYYDEEVELAKKIRDFIQEEDDKKYENELYEARLKGYLQPNPDKVIFWVDSENDLHEEYLFADLETLWSTNNEDALKVEDQIR